MRIVWVLLTSALCAALVLLAGLVAHGRFGSSSAAPAVDPVRLLAQDALTTRRLLALTCERDAQLERLLLELSAGAPETDAARQAQQLSRLLGGRVRLFVEQRGAVSELSPTSGRDGPVTLAHVKSAQRGRGVLQGELLADSCVATRGGSRLWLLRSIELSELLRASNLERRAIELSEVNTPTADDLPSLTGGRGLRVRALTPRADDGHAFLVLVALAAAGAVLGALLAFFLTRAQPVDEAVLSAIETATERVAQGDLSSQISLSVAGRADQTLRSFDRMTHELRETRAKLREAERAAAWQDMAQRIAHEIKNPLSPIKLALETLRKAHDKRLSSFDEIFAESTHAMLEEVARMEHIVREFSQFARLPKARPGALDLASLVQETAGLYAPEDVAVQLELPAEGLHVHADREQLVQVVVNLLTNALDAARTQLVPRVLVGASLEQREVRLWVEDNGPGVPHSERERIFEPYVTNKPHGTGLGLAIVRRIAQDHEGSIRVVDGSLGGARFELRLPQASLASATR